ncbi:MAG: glycosyltransferase [Acidimicrobiales bacterium]|nr:glycosyltransferase [Acidimicrobiales bacterium]
MTVVYDLLGVQSKEHGERGIARYVLSLALAIEELDPSAIDVYLVREYLPIPGVMEPLIRSGKVRTFRDMQSNPPKSGVFVVASPYELGEPLDSILPDWARDGHWQRAGILYDLIPMIFPEIYLTDLWSKRYRARTNTVANLDHLFAISEASKADGVRLLNKTPESITVIGAGADTRFAPPQEPQADVLSELQRRLPDLRESYLLFPSGIEWRKNLIRMFDAYSQLPADMRAEHQLVMVCRTNSAEQEMLEHETSTRGIQNDFLATGFVDDADLVRLYQAAGLVIFPSLYEGFGLPVLEARACGAPAICSDSSSLKEVQPDPTARFDPTDVDEMTAVLQRTLGNPDELKRLQDAEMPPFTWKWGAERTLPVLAELARRSSTRGMTKPRLAIVSPLPPQRSGIATYTYRLCAHLANEVDVTVLVDDETFALEAPDGVRIAKVKELLALERMDGRFDEVIYFMGNSHFHVAALEMLRQRPGAVLMHDVRMTGLYESEYYLAGDRLPQGTVGGLLHQLYPSRYRDVLYKQDIISPTVADRFGITLTREIAAHATRVFTHSQFAADSIMLDSGVVPEVLFPIPVHTAHSINGAPKGAGHPPVISTFGKVDPVKQPFLLIEAFAHVRQQFPNAQLVFVGDHDEQQEAALLAAIERGGVGDAVEITGHLSDAEYEAAIAATSIAVQLRAFTNGESSAAAADLIGSGVPVVVSQLGAMAELPEDVVVHVEQHATAAELAELLVKLLGDNARLESMMENGRLFAKANSYRAASDALVERLFPANPWNERRVSSDAFR